MKKLFTLLFILLTLQVSATTHSDDKPITLKELPTKSQQLISKHFAKHPIALVKKEDGFLNNSYEVIFSNGDKIEFDSKGNWETVDCKYSTLPKELVPVKISSYVSKNYPGVQITSIEKENRNRTEIGLANGLDLKFDSKFNLVSIDN